MPIGVPNRSERKDSMIGVNGWFSANQARGPGIDSVGTKPLLRKGRMIRNMGRLLAVSTLLVDIPSAIDSHVTARAVSSRMPIAATHSTGPVVVRKPINTATANTMARANIVWMMLPITWPVRTEVRVIAIVRKRAMIPAAMSIAIEMAVPCAAPATVTTRMPGTT